MRRPTFVPQPDLLENRLALSGGPKFTASGAAILTSHALSETYSDVQHAFVQLRDDGQNYQAAGGQPGRGREPHSVEQAGRTALDG